MCARARSQRMIFFAFLKVDNTLAGLTIVAVAFYMYNPHIWPDSKPVAGLVVLVSVVLGLAWAYGIFRAVVGESRRQTLTLSPLAFVQPAVLVYGLLSIHSFQRDVRNPSSIYYHPDLAIWWAPIYIISSAAILLRVALFINLLQVRRDFGEGLTEWDGPSAMNTGLLAGLTLDQRMACDVMCRGSLLLTLVAENGGKLSVGRTRSLFVLLTQNGSMLRWSWKGYLLLDDVYELRHHGLAEFGKRAFSLHYGQDFNHVLTLIFHDDTTHAAWCTGLEALLRETRRKLGVQHGVREWLLHCYRAHLDKQAGKRKQTGRTDKPETALVEVALRLNRGVTREWAAQVKAEVFCDLDRAPHSPRTVRSLSNASRKRPVDPYASTMIELRHVVRLYRLAVASSQVRDLFRSGLPFEDELDVPAAARSYGFIGMSFVRESLRRSLLGMAFTTLDEQAGDNPGDPRAPNASVVGPLASLKRTLSPSSELQTAPSRGHFRCPPAPPITTEVDSSTLPSMAVPNAIGVVPARGDTCLAAPTAAAPPLNASLVGDGVARRKVVRCKSKPVSVMEPESPPTQRVRGARIASMALPRQVRRRPASSAAPRSGLTWGSISMMPFGLGGDRARRSVGDTLEEGHWGYREFASFCAEHQREEREDVVAALFDLASKGHGHVQCDDLQEFLFSPENSAIDPAYAEVCMDMTQPLTAYFIESSHNTYATGDQLQSESSVDMYKRVLLMGCRCVEIDCFDGSDNEPDVYHKSTLTSRIKFRDVIQAIASVGFRSSPYPIIVSLEMHCSKKQQRKVAQHCVNLLGERLVVAPLHHNEDFHRPLPSPEDLRGKVLLKNKTLWARDVLIKLGWDPSCAPAGGDHATDRYTDMGDEQEESREERIRANLAAAAAATAATMAAAANESGKERETPTLPGIAAYAAAAVEEMATVASAPDSGDVVGTSPPPSPPAQLPDSPGSPGSPPPTSYDPSVGARCCDATGEPYVSLEEWLESVSDVEEATNAERMPIQEMRCRVASSSTAMLPEHGHEGGRSTEEAAAAQPEPAAPASQSTFTPTLTEGNVQSNLALSRCDDPRSWANAGNECAQRSAAVDPTACAMGDPESLRSSPSANLSDPPTSSNGPWSQALPRQASSSAKTFSHKGTGSEALLHQSSSPALQHEGASTQMAPTPRCAPAFQHDGNRSSQVLCHQERSSQALHQQSRNSQALYQQGRSSQALYYQGRSSQALYQQGRSSQVLFEASVDRGSCADRGVMDSVMAANAKAPVDPELSKIVYLSACKIVGFSKEEPVRPRATSTPRGAPASAAKRTSYAAFRRSSHPGEELPGVAVPAAPSGRRGSAISSILRFAGTRSTIVQAASVSPAPDASGLPPIRSSLPSCLPSATSPLRDSPSQASPSLGVTNRAQGTFLPIPLENSVSSEAEERSEIKNVSPAVVGAWWHKQPLSRRWLPFETASISEGKVLSLLSSTRISALRAHHDKQLTRVYPLGTRVGSSNMSATTVLSCMQAGCQLVCLNYQTNDAGQQLNRALFRLNGGCGYVLKRPLLGLPDEHMDSQHMSRVLELRILCAQHLHKPGEERIAPEPCDQFDPQRLLPSHNKAPSLSGASLVYCVLECWGGGASPEGLLQLKTRHVESNGLNPSWDERVRWCLPQPNTGFLRLSVYHKGVLKDELIGSEILPVAALREGYRSVGLRSAKGLRLQLAAVLLHVKLYKPGEMAQESRSAMNLAPSTEACATVATVATSHAAAMAGLSENSVHSVNPAQPQMVMTGHV